MAACPKMAEFQGMIMEHVTQINSMEGLAERVNKIFVVYNFTAFQKPDEGGGDAKLTVQEISSFEKESPIEKSDLAEHQFFADSQKIFEQVFGYACFIKVFHFSDSKLISAQKIFQECNASVLLQDKIEKLDIIFSDRSKVEFLKSLQKN